MRKKKNHRWEKDSKTPKVLSKCIYCGAERKFVWNSMFNCKTPFYRTPEGSISYFTAHITKPASNWTSGSAWRPGCIGIEGALERGIPVPPTKQNPVKAAERAVRFADLRKAVAEWEADVLQERIDQIDSSRVVTHRRARAPRLVEKSSASRSWKAARNLERWGEQRPAVRDEEMESDGLGAEC